MTSMSKAFLAVTLSILYPKKMLKFETHPGRTTKTQNLTPMHGLSGYGWWFGNLANQLRYTHMYLRLKIYIYIYYTYTYVYLNIYISFSILNNTTSVPHEWSQVATMFQLTLLSMHPLSFATMRSVVGCPVLRREANFQGVSQQILLIESGKRNGEIS